MIYKKHRTAVSLALLLSLCFPLSAFAQQSPEFAYSAEEWAALRDDKLEYEEIEKLVHEYNNTVLQNAISYRDRLGDTSADIAQEYYDAAEDIYSNITYPDSDDSNYASALTAAVNSKIQAENLTKQADENTDDAATLKIGYDQAEAELVKQAKQLMISYYSQQLALQNTELSEDAAERSVESARLKLAAGSGTEKELSDARETLLKLQASFTTASANLEKTKQNLILMLGWDYGADVDIGGLPEVPAVLIGSEESEKYLADAVENNFSLKKYKLQLSNAKNTNVIDKLNVQISNASAAIENAVSSDISAYNTAVLEYEQAVNDLEIKESELASAGRKLSAGIITQKTYDAAKEAADSAALSQETKQLSLLSVWQNLLCDVNGLAQAS